jgi:hypothetical protein
MSEESETRLDGNAVAGELREVFAVDLTTATCHCAYCGNVASFPESRVYGTQPGVIVRCNNCERPMMRFVTSPARAWIDLRGLQVLELSTPFQAVPERASDTN